MKQVRFAEDKIELFKKLKARFYEDLHLVHEKLEKVKNGVQANMKNDQNPHGLLTRAEDTYMSCLELKARELEELFQEDEAYWRENLDTIK